MLGELTKFSKQVLLWAVAITGLSILGNVFNGFTMFWYYVEIFFAVIRNVANLFAFMWDTQTLWTLVGFFYLTEISMWTWKTLNAVAKFFNEK